MRIVLIWRPLSACEPSASPATVAEKLQLIFCPLFGEPCPQRVEVYGKTAMVILELPVPGWKAEYSQADAQTRSHAIDYPINAQPVFKAYGVPCTDDHVLTGLCRELQHQPAQIMKDLAPPFSLVWNSTATGDTYLQNDGLGQSQFYEYQDDHVQAWSNKIFAFKALGIKLEPVPEEWAVWAALDWFPLSMTGYRRIRFLEPGTQLRLSDAGVSHTRCNVLADWVHPQTMSPNDSLELARNSLIELIHGCQPFWENPAVGLTGGWDSRAVVSALRAAGVEFRARVRGLPDRHDVVIASELAKVAGFRLKVEHSGGLPPETVEACRRSVALALLWQGGHMTAYRHKSFMVNQPRLEPRKLSITGQHGEIGRRERVLSHDYLSKQRSMDSMTESQCESYVLAELLADMPAFLNPSLRDYVYEVIRTAYRQADQYALTGPARVDFFSLYEFTRRKGSTVHAWQTRLLIAPFLNPDFIRAVFAYPKRLETNLYHRHMIAANTPEWSSIPYYEDLEAGKLARSPVTTAAGNSHPSPDWKQPTGRHNYDDSLYWQIVGKPIVDEALQQQGWWTEIFDPHAAAQHWTSAPDKLAVLHLLEEQLTHTK